MNIQIKSKLLSGFIPTCFNKLTFFKNIIQKTVISINRYKSLDIIGASEMNIGIENLENIYKQINKICNFLETNTNIDEEDIASKLQTINNDLFIILKTYGTRDIVDLLKVCFGSDYIHTIEQDTDIDASLYDIIVKYVRPINFKIIPWKNTNRNSVKQHIKKNRVVEDFTIVETSSNLDCFDLARTCKNFQTKVYGIKIAFHNSEEKKTMILSGIVEDILLECFEHDFVTNKRNNLIKHKPSSTNTENEEFEDFEDFVNSLTLKELLIYNHDELINRYVGYQNQAKLMKYKPISQIVKEFVGSELYGQRKTLIVLLLKKEQPEYQYLAYLLYDLLSNDNNGSIDTVEQTLLFDSLPWSSKKLFRSAMKNTIMYTKNLANYSNKNIPLEQQICLLKADDNVKEKAMIKLKEVKAKSEDSGSKARQYLEGLLKIPFGIYKNEPILNIMKECTAHFYELMNKINKIYTFTDIPIKQSYTSLEMFMYLKQLQDDVINKFNQQSNTELIKILTTGKRSQLIENICKINNAIKSSKLKMHKLIYSGKKNGYMKKEILNFINSNINNNVLLNNIKKQFGNTINDTSFIENDIKHILTKWENVTKSMNNTHKILNNAVYGHNKAKRNVERIIGQWMNGELNGYCFGFEGPPGVGKTSLAKLGLTKCLLDEDNNPRPFGFIPIGGSSNGSILDGHNYTYVGSTWGRLVDVLMDSKCMNPIIFIDELDKVSRTEHGKEIIGILTHLVDQTQNTDFQDKYFNGISLDLSKALIIFSYNDPSLIDRILLDRIHRIKFDSLTLDEKVIITYNYILPELLKKVALENVIEFPQEVVTYIIEQYTYESGVRKLKELLFEIISEINLEILKGELPILKVPLIINKDDVKHKYLSEHNEITITKIHDEPKIGIMNGLWANSLGKGGIIPIQTELFPTTTFLDLKLTGMQGDVMKESMNVAKTLAYKLTPIKQQKILLKQFKSTNMQGLHIHCPEGAVPKDGPSAGAAITTTIYSLLNNLPIKHNIAMTGEINLQHKITAIGGLKEKILGGIRAGVIEFIYPTTNQKDFDKFMKDSKHQELVKDITFHAVDNIKQVFSIVFGI